MGSCASNYPLHRHTLNINLLPKQRWRVDTAIRTCPGKKKNLNLYPMAGKYLAVSPGLTVVRERLLPLLPTDRLDWTPLPYLTDFVIAHHGCGWCIPAGWQGSRSWNMEDWGNYLHFLTVVMLIDDHETELNFKFSSLSSSSLLINTGCAQSVSR